jgi:hypothetical protein
MVRLTDSELDCLMNAARPLDVSARDAFLREVASALASRPAIGDGVVQRVVAEVQRRHSCRLIWRRRSPALGQQVPLSWSIWLESLPYSQEAAPTCFVAETEKFWTRSLGERAHKHRRGKHHE